MKGAAIIARAVEWANAPAQRASRIGYESTVEPLKILALDVAAGNVDASDLPDTPEAPWSSVMIWAEKKGHRCGL